MASVIFVEYAVVEKSRILLVSQIISGKMNLSRYAGLQSAQIMKAESKPCPWMYQVMSTSHLKVAKAGRGQIYICIPQSIRILWRTFSSAKWSAENAEQFTKGQTAKSRWCYWKCYGKQKHLCDNVNFTDYQLRVISAQILGTSEFYDEMFIRIIDQIIVLDGGDLKYIYKDGSEKIWRKL